MAQREIKEGEKGLVDGVWSIYGPGGWEPVEKLPGGGALPPNDLGERDSNMVDLDPEILKFIQDKNLTAPFATSSNIQEQIIENLQKASGGGLVTREAGKDLSLADIQAQADAKIRAGQGQIAQTQQAIKIEQQEQSMINLLRPYDIMLGDARKQLEFDLSRANAILTRSADGLGTDTATKSAIGDITNRAQQNMNKISAAREQARHNMRVENLEALSLMINNQREAVNDILKQVHDQTMDIYNLQSQQAQEMRLAIQTQWDIVSKLPAGKTWTDMFGNAWEGVAETDPFFTSANIVSLMKELPMGEERQITDPLTNEVWTIQGIAQPSINKKIYQSIDASGNMHIVQVNEDTGDVKELGVVRGAGKPMKPTTTDTDETLTAGEVRDIKYLTAPPQWFRDRLEKDREQSQAGQLTTPQPLTEQKIQDNWNEMRKQAKNLGVIDNESLAE